MKIIVVGDISAPNKTAAALAQGFANAFPDATVKAYPELSKDTWGELTQPRTYDGVTLLVWSKSRNLSERFDQRTMLAAARRAGVPTVAFHLDRWWGLGRSDEVFTDPFFQCDYVITTDGGNDDQWERARVNHVWMPPATTVRDTQWEPEFRADAAGKAVFVGVWERYHHREYRWRGTLIKQLRRRLGHRLVVYPNLEGEMRRVQGKDLADIYHSAAVVIGDSCLVGGTGRYWSDRVPITLGMGGLLIHPRVAGMEEFFDDRHLITVPQNDIDAYVDAIMKAGDSENDSRREAGRQAVIEGHTFDVRARQIAELVGAVPAYSSVQTDTPAAAGDAAEGPVGAG